MAFSTEAFLEKVLTAPQLQAEWFEPKMLDHMPLQQVQQAIADIKQNFGAYHRAQQIGQTHAASQYDKEQYFYYALYFVAFEQGRVTAQISLSGEGQIVDLAFQPTPMDFAAVIEQLQTLPGQVSFVVSADNAELTALNADQPLAVGDAAELVTLAALQHQVTTGQRRWSDVITLQTEWRNLPKGFLYRCQAGTHLTLDTLARLMVDVQDPTAADALIHVLGREALEVLAPSNQPFLTRRELLILKWPQNEALLERYRQLRSRQERLQLLNKLAVHPIPDIFTNKGSSQEHSSNPASNLDIGHFLTVRELSQLMAEVADLFVIATGTEWYTSALALANYARVACKHSQGLGLLNVTYQLEAKSGKTYRFSITWNDPEALRLDKMLLCVLCDAVIAIIQDLDHTALFG